MMRERVTHKREEIFPGLGELSLDSVSDIGSMCISREGERKKERGDMQGEDAAQDP